MSKILQKEFQNQSILVSLSGRGSSLWRGRSITLTTPSLGRRGSWARPAWRTGSAPSGARTPATSTKGRSRGIPNRFGDDPQLMRSWLSLQIRRGIGIPRRRGRRFGQAVRFHAFLDVLQDFEEEIHLNIPVSRLPFRQDPRPISTA